MMRPHAVTVFWDCMWAAYFEYRKTAEGSHARNVRGSPRYRDTDATSATPRSPGPGPR